MLGCVDRVLEPRPCSTGDYCESPDSSRRRGPTINGYNTTSTRHRTPSFPKCTRKQYRWSAACCYQPRSFHSIPTKRIQRANGRRMKRLHQVEETTSMDEHKSMTSFSSILTVDVSREMAAVNKDIEEIIRRCDDCCPDPSSIYKHCYHNHHHHRKCYRMGRDLTEEQARIMALKKIPMEKLKEVPLALLKPRPPKQFKEKSHSDPHAKPKKTSRDIRNIVEETDTLLRNVYLELSRAKLNEENNCLCMNTQVWGPTCLERYLGCQSKCRRMQENRWFNPKWKDVFDKAELYKIIKPNEEILKHFHDSACPVDSDPAKPSCIIKNRRDSLEIPRPKFLKDAEVNTETLCLQPLNSKVKQHFSDTNDELFELEKITFREKQHSVDSQTDNTFVNYSSDNQSGTASPFKLPAPEQKKQQVEDFSSSSAKTMDTSLLLDRNMGLMLDKVPDLKPNEKNYADGILISNKDVEEPISKSPEPYLSLDYFGGSPRSGAGDSVSTMEHSKVFLSQIINRIVNRPIEYTNPIVAQSVDVSNLQKADADFEEVDTGMCLEIMKRIVDLMSKHHRKQMDFPNVPSQFTHVRKMKQQHLANINKEINSILDLELYMRNASPGKS